MSEHPFDLKTTDLTPGERRLMAHLAELIRFENALPLQVEEAAKALHDWAGVDGHLAELSCDAVLTRSDESAYTFAFDGFRVRADVEPCGYRRRRLALEAGAEDEVSVAEEMTLQFPDGTSRTVQPDRFGAYVAEIPAGTVRAIVVFDSGTIATPWFTI